MNIKQLRQKREAAHTTAKGIASTAGDNLMTAEQKTAFDAAVAERNALDEQIAAFEALQTSDRTTSATATSGFSVGKNLAEDKPWDNLGEQLLAIREYKTSNRATVDPRLQAALGQSEGVDADGGFAIAPEFSKEILASIYEVGQIASRVFDIPMQSKTYTMPAVDENSRANGSRWGGVQAFWNDEGSPLTRSQAKLKNLTLSANKLTALLYDTNEVAEDAPALGKYIQRVVPDELAFKVDDAIYNGPGSGMPLGFLQSGALVTVPKDAAQAAATISTANVLNMWARMPASSRRTAVWFVTQDALAQLLNLTRGAGMAVEFLYKAPGDRGNLGGTTDGMMLGSPVIVVEQAAALGVVGDITYVDPQMYVLGRRGALRADTSIHVAFTTDEQAYRFILRVDGQPIWKQPRAQFNGGNLLSPFIALQAR